MWQVFHYVFWSKPVWRGIFLIFIYVDYSIYFCHFYLESISFDSQKNFCIFGVQIRYVIDIDNFIFDVHYKWRKSTMFLLCKDFRLMNFCTVFCSYENNVQYQQFINRLLLQWKKPTWRCHFFMAVESLMKACNFSIHFIDLTRTVQQHPSMIIVFIMYVTYYCLLRK